MTEAHDPGFHVERVDLQDGRTELRFAGQLRFRQCFASWQSVRHLARPPAAHLAFDLTAVDTLDGAATALLLELRDEVVAAGAEAEIVGAHGGVRAMLELYGSHPPRPSLQPPPARIGILDEIGRRVLSMLSEGHGLDFIGDLMVAGARAARTPLSVNWRDVPRLMERAGADSLPIVLVINFLVGLVTAFQAAVQLRQF
ncbi:MAG: STAS domain-containing protein, partial [Deltaproteobacteria bacterium]